MTARDSALSTAIHEALAALPTHPEAAVDTLIAKVRALEVSLEDLRILQRLLIRPLPVARQVGAHADVSRVKARQLVNDGLCTITHAARNRDRLTLTEHGEAIARTTLEP
jgi:hypothetical protein